MLQAEQIVATMVAMVSMRAVNLLKIGLILLLLVREIARFHIFYIVRNRFAHNGIEVGITT